MKPYETLTCRIKVEEMGERAKDKNFMRVVRASRNAPLIQLMEDAQDPKKLQKVKKDFAKALKASRKRVANSATELRYDESKNKDATKDESLSDEIDEEKWKEFMNLKRFQRLVYYRGRLLSNGCSYYGKGMDAGRIKIMWYPGVECEKPHMTGK